MGCHKIQEGHEECTHKLEQTNANDPQQLPKMNTKRQEEPRLVTRGTNKTKIEIFSLGEPEGVITLTNPAGITFSPTSEKKGSKWKEKGQKKMLVEK